jgi:hypothetical protein
VSCTITQINPGDTVFANDGWMLEIDDFAPYSGDGWIIFDLELHNPINPMWTGVWRAITYESKLHLSYRIDDNDFTAGG